MESIEHLTRQITAASLGRAIARPCLRRYGRRKVGFMVRSWLLGATLFLMGCSSNSQLDTLALPEPIDYVTYVEHQSAFTLERLHRLKVVGSADVERSMEESLALDAHTMLALIDSGKLSESDIDRLQDSLARIYVFSKKFDFEVWREDQQLQGVLVKIAASIPEKISKYQCKDWSKPMWVGEDLCS